MIDFHLAKEIIFEHVSKVKTETETIPLDESIGRILADDVFSDVNLPPFTNSAMDGYAIKFNPDIRSWIIIDEIRAGHYQDICIDENHAVSIMTGAKLPDGADTVIPVEDCKVEGNRISIVDDFELKLGWHSRLTGEDLKLNSLAIERNTLIKSNNIHLLASCGMSSLTVYKKLTIGVFTTGDELVPVDVMPENDQIRSSNLSAIKSAILSLNMNAIDLGIVKDSPELIESKFMEAIDSDMDILLTCGGVSVGKYDFVQDVLKKIGAEVVFWKVNIKPGKPLLFCVYHLNNRYLPIICLPGNPVSSYLNFRLLIEPAIMKLYDIDVCYQFTARLVGSLSKTDTKRHFVLGISHFDSGFNCFLVESAGNQSSGAMASLSNSNCLIVIPEKKLRLEEGEFVECIRI
jgi:molybdopterin molybdotransferase